MATVFEKYRSLDGPAGFCYVDVIVNSNDAPGDIVVDLSVDNIYFADVQGADLVANQEKTVEEVLDVGFVVS